jgi:hypothetical protein
MEKEIMKKERSGSPMIGLEGTLKRLGDPMYKNIWNNFLNYANKNNSAIFNKVSELNKLVDELYKITPKPDIRQYNFGYDANGILKALDI